MIATGSISGSSILRAGADPQTGNSDTLAHAPQADVRCYTDSILQARIDANDTIISDAAEISFALVLPGGTFTAVAATNVITTSVNHGLSLYDPIKFRNTGGAAPGGINTGGTFTADATTDEITTSGAHALKVGDEIVISNSGGALPAGLTAGSVYVQSVVSTTKITVALTPGGDRIDLTDAGTGAHSWIPIRTYYVLTTPATNTLTVSEVPGGTVLDITSTGTGTHSFQGYPAKGATLSYAYPTTGPNVPVIVKQKRSGSWDDFTTVRNVHVALIPTDPALAASGQAMLKMGDPTDAFAHLSVPLKFTHDPDAASNPACFWEGSLPVGLLWNTDYPLKVKIKEGVSNVNLSVLINLLGY